MRRWFMPVLMLWALPAGAECRLALALAVDVSRSIDATDFVIQTEGLAAALADPDVQAAIFGPEGTVALAVYQWSGPSHQEMIQPWVMLDGPGAFVEVAPQQVDYPPAIRRKLLRELEGPKIGMADPSGPGGKT